LSASRLPKSRLWFQILQGLLNNPDFDRRELSELRKFIKRPLVGASVQNLRKALQSYGDLGDVTSLIETVRDLYRSQGTFNPTELSEKKPIKRIKREDLRLVCYEYVYA
jgi:hypothetical protein